MIPINKGTIGSRYKNNHLPDQPESWILLDVTARVGMRRSKPVMVVSGVGWFRASIMSSVSIGGQMMDSNVESTIPIRTVASTKNQYSRLEAVPLNFLKFTNTDFTA
jgi:hypothetical protein